MSSGNTFLHWKYFSGDTDVRNPGTCGAHSFPPFKGNKAGGQWISPFSDFRTSAPIDYTRTACMFLDIVSTSFSNGKDLCRKRLFHFPGMLFLRMVVQRYVHGITFKCLKLTLVRKFAPTQVH